jgi:GNAT superfamily N-acetyltransferase
MNTLWRLRPFLNTDTPALARIWAEHHSLFCHPSECSVGLWDQCILCKPYFSFDDLVLAVDPQGVAQGLIHFGVALAEGGNEVSTECGMIHCLCIVPHEKEQEIARHLLQQAIEGLKGRGLSRCLAVGSPTGSTFYLGVAEGDNLIGVPSGDHRAQQWLQDGGFRQHAPTECWAMSLDTFRPPMDRTQISIRRNCTISRILDDYPSNWWLSNMLGHCEQTRFHLRSRGPDQIEMEIMLWAPDTSIRGVDSSIVRFQLPSIPNDDENRERLVYLIAESLRQLQSERKRRIHVVTLSDDLAASRVLQRLGFRSAMHGMVFERSWSKQPS